MRGTADLRGYQVGTIKLMLKNKTLPIFIKMGGGKTAIVLHAIRHMLRHSLAKKILVVSTKAVVLNVWRQEAKLWDYTKGLTFNTLQGAKRKERYSLDANITLVNFENLPWLINMFGGNPPYDTLIIDESTKLKSPSTVRFKKLKSCLKHFDRRYILTGTPIPNSYMDIWAQWFIFDLGKDFTTHITHFRNRYFTKVWDYLYETRPGAEDILDAKIQAKAVYIDPKDHISLPDMLYNYIEMQMPSSEMEQYLQFKKEFFLQIEEAEIEAKSAAGMGMKLRQLTQGAVYYYSYEEQEEGTFKKFKKLKHLHTTKLAALQDAVEQIPGNLIISIQFKFEVEQILEIYPKAKVINGATKDTELKDNIDTWNAGTLKILIVHPSSVSHGLNLQYGGSDLIWYSHTFSLEQYQQLNARLLRPGQNNTVFIHHLVFKNTTDKQMLQSLQTKDERQERILNEIKTKFE